ncbi:MAG: SDR family oxidoreductase [Firmicutes bacterium]|nr:SDR family oxidoreductase [Bacillota bacterium]
MNNIDIKREIKRFWNRIPAGKWGTPEDLQGPAAFLASGAASYLHGYTIAVDGGWHVR